MYNNFEHEGSNPSQGDVQTTFENRQRPYIPQEPEKKGRNGKTAKRVAGITAAALLFGTVSGGTMVGVNMLADRLNGNQHFQTSSAEPVPETEESQAVTLPEVTRPSETGKGVGNLLAMDVSGIVETAMPSVVAINNTVLYQSQSWFGSSQTYEVPSSGSGIIVGQNDEELLIVTNNHVVENSKDLQVVFIDNESVQAAVKGTDAENDLAVIAVPLKDIPSDTMSQISIATLGNSDDLKVGQGVIAIGNALGYGQSVTVGYVSALNREVKTRDSDAKNLLQTDAAINPGNSGGALLNMKGEVIGINAAKYSSTDVEGMGYAIPISKVQDIIGDLMTKKTRVEVAQEKQGYLGIRGEDVTEQMSEAFGMPKGIYITEIIGGAAADSSELRENDIITKFDGQSVRSMEELRAMLSYYEGGTEVVLTVQSLENGKYVERKVSLVLGSRPEAAN
ncbi:trypsin-like peptidase domain-containing protein [Lachnospiraceae bacterium 62-35]